MTTSRVGWQSLKRSLTVYILNIVSVMSVSIQRFKFLRPLMTSASCHSIHADIPDKLLVLADTRHNSVKSFTYYGHLSDECIHFQHSRMQTFLNSMLCIWCTYWGMWNRKCCISFVI